VLSYCLIFNISSFSSKRDVPSLCHRLYWAELKHLLIRSPGRFILELRLCRGRAARISNIQICLARGHVYTHHDFEVSQRQWPNNRCPAQKHTPHKSTAIYSKISPKIKNIKNKNETKIGNPVNKL
jgi:hypothetical protein